MGLLSTAQACSLLVVEGFWTLVSFFGDLRWSVLLILLGFLSTSQLEDLLEPS